MSFEEFRKEPLGCRNCAAIGIDPNPIFWGEVSAKVVQISQAPSRNADNSSRPFSKSMHESDASGKKLIEWYGIPRETFYDPKVFYITGIGHCYPGKDRGGDAKPPMACAERWLARELSYLDLIARIGKIRSGTLRIIIMNWLSEQACLANFVISLF